jgi:4-hydroxy-tetrahydrodipicolinate reductase
MVQIAICGCCGKMGHVVADTIAGRDDCKVVAGIDILGQQYSDFPVYKNIFDCKEKIDVIIDFSHPSALFGILEFGKKNNTAVVVATTGMTDEHINMIKESSNDIPIFFTYNMSLGINLLAELASRAAKVLGSGFDIEIVEAHHNQKIDAPSGTAIMLADAITAGLDDEYHYEYDRHSRRQKRDSKEIGMHSIRGGTIVGEHSVIFAGRDEIVTLSHSARSKEIFAVGAVNAAVFLSKKVPKIYTMQDLVASI